jgi:hypothetical protein
LTTMPPMQNLRCLHYMANAPDRTGGLSSKIDGIDSNETWRITKNQFYAVCIFVYRRLIRAMDFLNARSAR